MKEFGIESWGIKMDIEGSEKEVFEQSPNPWINRVSAIAVEIHDSFRGRCGESVQEATRDFPFKWQKADVTYLSRTAAPRNDAEAMRPKLPMKILQNSLSLLL